jgi:hypothetical protein
MGVPVIELSVATERPRICGSSMERVEKVIWDGVPPARILRKLR